MIPGSFHARRASASSASRRRVPAEFADENLRDDFEVVLPHDLDRVLILPERRELFQAVVDYVPRLAIVPVDNLRVLEMFQHVELGDFIGE